MVTPAHARVLIVGASRGLGLAMAAEYLARGARVVGTVRSASPSTLRDLRGETGERVQIERVDITDEAQVSALRQRLHASSFDLLVVNAGVTNGPDETVANVTTEEFTRLMVTNALSPLRVIETLGDLVTEGGTIAIMSSGQGSVANNNRGGFEIYRASKSALNQLMRSYAARHRDGSRTLLLLAPGWVKTDLGGPGAALTIEESIPNLVSTIEGQVGRPGLHYLDYRGQTVAW